MHAHAIARRTALSPLSGTDPVGTAPARISQLPTGPPLASVVSKGTIVLAVKSKMLPVPNSATVRKLRFRKLGDVVSNAAGNRFPAGVPIIKKPTKKLGVFTVVGEILTVTNVLVPAFAMTPLAVANTVASDGLPSPFGSLQSTA